MPAWCQGGVYGVAYLLRLGCLLAWAFVGLALAVDRLEASQSIPDGYLGTRGNNDSRLNDAHRFSTLGISVSYFIPGGVFGGTQGNDGAWSCALSTSTAQPQMFSGRSIGALPAKGSCNISV